jgi:hypothetical protein
MPIRSKTNRRIDDRSIDHFSGHSAIGGHPLFAPLVKREKTRHFGANTLEIRNDTESSINHKSMPATADGLFDFPRDLVNPDDP